MPYKDPDMRREASRLSKAKRRAECKAQGWIRIELWVKPSWKQAIIDFVNKLRGE